MKTPQNALAIMDTQPGRVKDSPVATWNVVGAAVRGVSHTRLDLPCQDAQDWRVLPGGILLVALADGAGSARNSDQGARAAVDRSLEAFADALVSEVPAGAEGWTALARAAFSEARQAVFELSEASGEGAREYASTLTCVAAAENFLLVAQLGDGAVVAGENGELFSAVRLQRGEYANETHFLTQENALDVMVVEVFERPVRRLAVMSDGLIRLALKMPDQEPHIPFFEPLFRFVSSIEAPGAEEQLATFLQSERVNARTDDDKTLVLAVRADPPLQKKHTEGEDGVGLERGSA